MRQRVRAREGTPSTTSTGGAGRRARIPGGSGGPAPPPRTIPLHLVRHDDLPRVAATFLGETFFGAVFFGAPFFGAAFLAWDRFPAAARGAADDFDAPFFALGVEGFLGGGGGGGAVRYASGIAIAAPWLSASKAACTRPVQAATSAG